MLRELSGWKGNLNVVFLNQMTSNDDDQISLSDAVAIDNKAQLITAIEQSTPQAHLKTGELEFQAEQVKSLTVQANQLQKNIAKFAKEREDALIAITKSHALMEQTKARFAELIVSHKDDQSGLKKSGFWFKIDDTKKNEK